MPRNTAQRPLASLLAHSLPANDLFPLLHQHALDVTDGTCSLLLQHNPRTGSLQVTSAFGLDALRTDPWLPATEESSIVADAFNRRAPALVADAAAHLPDLGD